MHVLSAQKLRLLFKCKHANFIIKPIKDYQYRPSKVYIFKLNRPVEFKSIKTLKIVFVMKPLKHQIHKEITGGSWHNIALKINASTC